MWYQSKSTSSTASAAAAALSEAASPSVQAVTLYCAAAEGLAQVAERRVAGAVEVRAERPDGEEQHDHDDQDAGRGGQHEQPLPAQARPPLFAERAPRL